MFNHIKANKWSFCGVEFTEEYLQRVQIPLLLTLGWNASNILPMLERVEFPLGQLARMPQFFNVLEERRVAQEQAEKERLERERLAFLNSPEQIAKREREHQEFIQHAQRQAAIVRGARPKNNSYANAPIISMFD